MTKDTCIGVVNGKSETKHDGETGISLCEPETFLPFKMRDRDL